MTHEIIIVPEDYEKVKRGDKNYVLRKNNRDYKVHDILRLRAWWDGQYLDKPPLDRAISYVRVDKLMDDHVVLGFKAKRSGEE